MEEQTFDNEEGFSIGDSLEEINLGGEAFEGFNASGANDGSNDGIDNEDLNIEADFNAADTGSDETGVIVGKMDGECYLFADGEYVDLLKRVGTIQRISELQGKDINFKVLTIDPDMLLKLRNNAELVSETFKPYFPEKDDISVKVELSD